jgi:TonB family protein
MMPRRSVRTLSGAALAVGVCVLSTLASGQMSSVPAPKKIKDVKPVYPPESLKAGDEGVLLIELSLTAAGRVEKTRILWSGCERLEKAAVTAVRQWQYAPVPINGKAVPFSAVVQVSFTLPTEFRSRAGQPGACRWKEAPKPTP